MPRHPKPVPLRRQGLVAVEPFAAPEAPPGLLARSRQRWDLFWSSPLVRVIVPDLDIDAIEQLFLLRDERDRAMRVGRRNRLVGGSMGQQVLNPLLPYSLQLMKEIRALEDRLAGNPKARLALGVLLGDAARSLEDVNSELERDESFDSLLDGEDVLDRRTG